MRQSQLFSKTRREAPSDETALNAKLLIRAGFINKEMAGVYDYLPLGLRVLKKIENIIREEMDAIGGQELTLSALQDKELWEKTDRWSDEVVDIWFKTKLKNDGEIGLGFTHEEPLTRLMKDHISSYRDLPVYAYQFQTKFRNETRAKSGVMRTREFIMKDLYSFSRDEKEHSEFYEKAKKAYINIFNRVGIGELTYCTRASGGVFSKYSNEFQTITNSGEDEIKIIYIDKINKEAVNKELWDDPVSQDLLNTLGIDLNSIEPKKSVEVGNIFTLGTKFSDNLGLNYKNESGQSLPVFMGSYGIGLERLMGTVVEVLSDDKGIKWPMSIAPFRIHLLEIISENSDVRSKAEEVYRKLSEKYEVLYDDRDTRAGEKFADADLLGIPIQIILGERGLTSGKAEVKDRRNGQIREVELEKIGELIDEIK